MVILAAVLVLFLTLKDPVLKNCHPTISGDPVEIRTAIENNKQLPVSAGITCKTF